MLLATILLLAGAAVLTAGAEAAVRGAGRLAVIAGIPAFALGALLFGIDFEGLSAALLAAGRGRTELASGEVFGTVLFLSSLAFGLALLLSPEPVASPRPLMVIAPGVALAAAGLAVYDRGVDRIEGAVLVALYGAYVALVVSDGRAVRARAGAILREAAEVGGGRARALWVTVLGLGALYGGAWMLVEGGARILDRTGLRAGFVGAAVLGTLVSLDEVLLEVLPVRRGQAELATGNLFGTVAAFPTAVFGLAALVRPLSVDTPAGVALIASTVLYVAVSAAFLLRGRAGRLLGALLLAAYPAWLVAGSRL